MKDRRIGERRRSNRQKPEWWNRLHFLWTKAVGQPGYDRRQWQDFELCLEKLHKAKAQVSAPPSECDCVSFCGRRMSRLPEDAPVGMQGFPAEEVLATLRVLWNMRRCPICAGPLMHSQVDGCVLGDCSYRPERGTDERKRIDFRRRMLIMAPEDVPGWKGA